MKPVPAHNEALSVKIALLPLPAKFLFKPVSLTLARREDRIAKSGSRNKAFRSTVIQAYCSAYPEELRPAIRWHLEQFWDDVHHIEPRSYGGQDENNRAVLPRCLHNKAHHILDRQTRGMKVGETREINLPYLEGIVWGFEAVIVSRPKGDWRKLEPFRKLRDVA